MRGHHNGGGQRRPAIVAISGAAMLASLAGACLATSRAIEPGTAEGPLPPPLPTGPSASATRQPRSFTVVATGDIAPAAAAAPAAPGGGLDYRRPLRPVLSLISGADLAICHIATPLAPTTPPTEAAELAGLGYDTCSTASDRALDAGAGGVARTLESLDRAGVRHTGTARDAAEAATPTIVNVNGVRVAQLSYAADRAGSRLPRTTPWLTNRIDPGRIVAAARRARRAGARVVIVSLHWGRENRRAATPSQIALARRLLAAEDIDLIVGHGADVVQPFGRAVGGKYVAYGLGHLLAAPRGRGAADGTAEHAGIVARFTFTRGDGGWRVTRAEYVPTYIDRGPPPRVLDVTAALADPRLTAARRAVLADVLRGTTRTVRGRGVAPILAGARPGPIRGVIPNHGRPGN
jgi:hypothetical protein